MHMEAMMGRVWRCTWRPGLRELRDALGGRDRGDTASLAMHWEAVIERVWRCNWRPRLSELTDALRGCDQVRSDMHFDLEGVDGKCARC
jgi:hypothetical protein